MKKALIVCMIASYAGIMSAQAGIKGIKKENVFIHATTSTPEQFKEEYQGGDDDDSTLEYEQYVCDHTKPPKISAAMAFLTAVGGRVLIEFITFREVLRRYFIALKSMVSEWTGLVTT